MTHNNTDVAALLLRLSLGTMYIAHGLWKVLALSMPVTVSFFVAHGFPSWTAYAVVVAELVGGTLLLLGVQVRIVAALLIPILLGALKVHMPNGFVFSYPNGGWEYPAFLIVASAVQSLLGAGFYALDRIPLSASRVAAAGQ